ncbi:glycoside hydrolase family 5 protein [Hydnum rufescens UP504]|uniref:Glycoside hydrolase family 5 protein n=1 Tax=Hydnum rufescens UP504 TaxID=1448309 RepID=A0A9P6AKP8_9AGAM|nr:glycoside hydrolase family 5 protein [Hydnum rufescens UP504]
MSFYLFLLVFASARAINLRFPYGTQPVRGVSLGGWLVLEPWITPSLFVNTGNPNIVDEWTFAQLQNTNTARSALQNHWSTFYTESDFSAIAAAGLNHVRIPIGYWAFDTSAGEPYINGQFPHLKTAVTWAANHGLKVMIDIHGVPGSQNGFDNSGHTGPANWANDQNNIRLEFSQQKYAGVVTSISVINEPAPFKSSNILQAARQLYLDSYALIRNPFSNGAVGNLLMVISDAFQPLSFWNGFMKDHSKYQGVALDHHSYDVFSNAEVAKSYSQHINSICQVGQDIRNNAAANLWTIVGEWTTASTDCARSRYDGSFPGSPFVGNCGPKTGSASNFSPNYKVFMRRFYEAQVAAYELGKGWIYWTWKNESADDWSYLAGLNGGWIPHNPSERLYGNICGF